MHEAQAWRDLLGKIIRDSKEKQRLIDEMGITAITLTRWINGESDPRPQNLRHLLAVLPQYRDQLRTLMREEKGLKEFAIPVQNEAIKEVPAEFYVSILKARSSTSEKLHFWSTCHLILQQAIGQLDPERQGMSIWVVQCMPPSGPYKKVRSLRESIGIGTNPWGGNIEQNAMFLGAESLAGHVVTQCRPGIIQNLDEEHNLTPATRVEFEKSAAIYPILYASHIAGVLLVSSTQIDYFQLEARKKLVQQYADLVALAFEPELFYAPEEIALCVMPSHPEQKPYFSNFRQRVMNTMISAAAKKHRLNTLQTDMLVWQQLEEELLHVSLRNIN